jgi:hypothetical protein
MLKPDELKRVIGLAPVLSEKLAVPLITISSHIIFLNYCLYAKYPYGFHTLFKHFRNKFK